MLSTAPAVGPDNVSRRLPMVNNYDDRLRGAEDYLLTLPLNPAGATSPDLTFSIAYQPYGSANNDGLRVDISTDCGTTFILTGYLKRGAALATVAIPNTNAFAPTNSTQWRQETVDLRSFRTVDAPTGQVQSVVLRFVNLNDYGNNLYLTNVGVAERVVSAATMGRQGDTFTAVPVPFAGQLRVAMAAAPAGAATLQLSRCPGRLPLTLRSSAQQIEFGTENLPAGVYVLRLSGTNSTQQLKVLK